MFFNNFVFLGFDDFNQFIALNFLVMSYNQIND